MNWDDITRSDQYQQADDYQKEVMRNNFIQQTVDQYGWNEQQAAQFRTEFDRHTAPRGNIYSGELNDAWNSIRSGAASATADMAQFFTAGTPNALSKGIRGYADDWAEDRSPSTIQAVENFGFGEGQEITGRGFAYGALSGLGSMAPMVAGGGLLGKGLQYGGKALSGYNKASKALDAADNMTDATQAATRLARLDKNIGRASSALGHGAVGGAMVGGGAGNQTYQEVMALDDQTLLNSKEFQNYYRQTYRETPDNKRQAFDKAKAMLAGDLAAGATARAGAIGAASMAVLGPQLQRIVTGKGPQGMIKGGAAGAATEGIQETFEGGGQQWATNTELAGIDGRSQWQDVANVAATGAVLGMGSGGPMGALGGAFNRGQQMPTQEQLVNRITENQRQMTATEQALREHNENVRFLEMQLQDPTADQTMLGQQLKERQELRDKAATELQGLAFSNAQMQQMIKQAASQPQTRPAQNEATQQADWQQWGSDGVDYNRPAGGRSNTRSEQFRAPRTNPFNDMGEQRIGRDDGKPFKSVVALQDYADRMKLTRFPFMVQKVNGGYVLVGMPDQQQQQAEQQGAIARVNVEQSGDFERVLEGQFIPLSDIIQARQAQAAAQPALNHQPQQQSAPQAERELFPYQGAAREFMQRNGIQGEPVQLDNGLWTIRPQQGALTDESRLYVDRDGRASDNRQNLAEDQRARQHPGYPRESAIKPQPAPQPQQPAQPLQLEDQRRTYVDSRGNTADNLQAINRQARTDRESAAAQNHPGYAYTGDDSDYQKYSEKASQLNRLMKRFQGDPRDKSQFAELKELIQETKRLEKSAMAQARARRKPIATVNRVGLLQQARAALESQRMDEFNHLMTDIRQTNIEEQHKLSGSEPANNNLYDSRLSNQQYREYLQMTVEEVQAGELINKARKTNKGKFGQVQPDDTLLWAIGRLGGLKPGSVEGPIVASIDAWVQAEGNKQRKYWLNERTGYTLDDMGRILAGYGYYDNTGQEYGENSLTEAIWEEIAGRPRFSHAMDDYSQVMPQQGTRAASGASNVTVPAVSAALNGEALSPAYRKEVSRILDEAESDPYFDRPEYLNQQAADIEQSRQDNAVTDDWYDRYEQVDIVYAEGKTGLDSDQFTEADWEDQQRRDMLLDAAQHESNNQVEENERSEQENADGRTGPRVHYGNARGQAETTGQGSEAEGAAAGSTEQQRGTHPQEVNPSDFTLTTQTEQALQQQAGQQKAAEAEAQKREEQARQKAAADKEADDFVLSGSNSVSDQAAARGQADLLGAQSTSNQSGIRNHPEYQNLIDFYGWKTDKDIEHLLQQMQGFVSSHEGEIDATGKSLVEQYVEIVDTSYRAVRIPEDAARAQEIAELAEANGYEWRQNSQERWAWFKNGEQFTGAYKNEADKLYATEVNLFEGLLNNNTDSTEAPGIKDHPEYDRIDRVYGKLSDKQIREKLQQMDADIQQNSKAARREFNNNGGRRTSAAISAQAVRDIGQEKLLLKAYLEERSSNNDQITEPTEAQKQAGNYKKEHIKLQGLDISLENKRGSTRSGTDPDGNEWSVTMAHDYGYIKRTEGADGDQVDVFVGKNPDSDQVFIVDQVNQDGSFDEHKVMLGFTDRASAIDGYKANYQKGWKVGEVTQLSMGDFKNWLKEGDTTRPASKQRIGDNESNKVTVNTRINFTAIVRDENGEPFFVLTKRHGKIELAPFKNGKPFVNADSAFWADLKDANYTHDNEWFDSDTESIVTGTDQERQNAKAQKPTSKTLLRTNGEPFKSERAARASKQFKSNPGAEVVEVGGGYGVNVDEKSESLKDSQPTKDQQAFNRLQSALDDRDGDTGLTEYRYNADISAVGDAIDRQGSTDDWYFFTQKMKSEFASDQREGMDRARKVLFAEDQPSTNRYSLNSEKNLFVVHNLTEKGLIEADKLGGLAAPSIAVARSDVSNFDGFGEISLLAKPELLNDKKTRTFDADIYSPRQPRAHYDIDSKAFYQYVRSLDPDNLGLSKPEINESSGTSGAQDFINSQAVELAYLQEIGKVPAMKNARVDRAIRNAARGDIPSSPYGIERGDTFYSQAKKYYQRKLKDMYEKAPDRANRFEEMYFDDNGEVHDHKVRDFHHEVKKYKDSGGKDVRQFRNDINKKLRSPRARKAFEQWATDKFNSMVKGRKIFKGFTDSGNRRYSDYNLQNVVKEMTQQLQAGENFFYGAGTIRSAYANEFKTIKDIQAKRNNIITEAELEQIKEESGKVLEDALEQLKPFYKYEADGFGYMNDAGSAIAEGRKGQAEAFNLTPEAKKIIDDLVEYLTALPTTYFEAKAQRAVSFSEFDTAIVPRGTDKKVLEILKNAGLKVKTYDRKKTGDRQRVIAAQNRLLFKKGRPAAGISQQAANRAASTIGDQLGVTVNVATDESQLPQHIRNQMQADGVSSVKGIFDNRTGQAWIVSGNLNDEAEAIRTVLHEVAGHQALTQMLGDTMNSIMARIHNDMPADVRARIEKDYASQLKGMDAQTRKAVVAEEYLAHLAETNPTSSTFKRFVSKVRRVLRKLFPSIEWTNDDVVELLEAARKKLKGGGPNNPNDGSRYSQSRPKPESDNYRDSLDKAMNSRRSNVPPITVTNTPDILQSLGVKDLPITIQRDVVRKVTNGVRHNISMNVIEQLPEHLSDPELVFNGGKPGSLSIVINARENGEPVMIALHLEVKEDRYIVNKIASVYGRPEKQYRNWVQDGKLRYVRNKESLRLIRLTPLQLRAVVHQLESPDPKIATAASLVKAKADRKDRTNRYSLAATNTQTTLSDDVQDVMDKVHGGKHQQAGIVDRVKNWLRDMDLASKTTWQAIGDKFYTGMIDQFDPIAKMEKGVNAGKLKEARDSAYKATLRTKNLDGIMTAVLGKGTPQLKEGSVVVRSGSKGLLDIFEPLARAGQLEVWETWAAAKRAQRLLNEGRENLFSQADIDTINRHVNARPELKQQFEQAHKQYQAFNKQILDFAQESGLIDPDSRQLWETDDYLPFHRVNRLDDGQQSSLLRRKGLSNQQSGIKQLEGGVDQISPMEAIYRNTASLIDASMKNIAMQRISDVGVAAGAMEKTNGGIRLTMDQVKERLVDKGILDGKDTLTQEQKKRWEALLIKFEDMGEGSVKVSRDGKTEVYHVKEGNEDLLETMQAMGPDTLHGILKVFAMPKRLLTSMVTADPGFMARNFVRDTLSTWMTVHPEIGGKTLHASMAEAVANVKKGLESDDHWALMMAGGGSGGFYEVTPENIRGKLTPGQYKAHHRRVMDNLEQGWQWWQKQGGRFENANRLAVFSEAIENGASIAEAAHQAQDVLNFTRRGKWQGMRILTEIIPFLNARVQGLDRLARGGIDNPSAMLLRGSMYMAASMALYFMFADDERYKELPDHEKLTWHHLWLPDGNHIRIPKPFEMGAIFATLPEVFNNVALNGEDGEWAGKMIGKMFTDVFAMGMPQIIAPALDVARNRNSFTDAPILSLGMQYQMPESQYTPWTSETTKALAEAMPDGAPEWMRSPKRLEYLLRGYFGTLGSYVLMSADALAREARDTPQRPEWRVRQYPVIGSFIRGNDEGATRYSTEMYDMLRESSALASTIKNFTGQGRLAEAAELEREGREALESRKELNRYSRQISKLKKEVRRILDSRFITAPLKKQRIDRLNGQINNLYEEATREAGH